MFRTTCKVSPESEISQTTNIQCEAEKKPIKNINKIDVIVEEDAKIETEIYSPTRKSALSKALACASILYKDKEKDKDSLLCEIPKDTNKKLSINPALLKTLWIDFESSDSEADEPIRLHTSNVMIDHHNYEYKEYDSSTYESESEESYHSGDSDDCER